MSVPVEPASQASEAQREARDRAIVRACTRLPAALLVVTAAYATTRYVVFGPIAAAHIPLYVLNKAFAWTGIVLLALALGLGPAARLWPALGAHLWRRRWWGLVGFALATTHIVMSLAILNYGYYRQMFRQAFEFTPLAESAMLAGGLAWLALLAPVAASLPGVRAAMSARYWQVLQRVGVLALVLAGLHLAYGVPGWLTPALWFGGLPPITLWSASAVVVALGLRVLSTLKGIRKQP
jgi:DMSO/TMAO reductase YedYZ heme-binding membrane subunit